MWHSMAVSIPFTKAANFSLTTKSALCWRHFEKCSFTNYMQFEKGFASKFVTVSWIQNISVVFQVLSYFCLFLSYWLSKNGCTYDLVEQTITTIYDNDSQGEKGYRLWCVQRDVSHRTELLYLLLLWLSPKFYVNVMFSPHPVTKTYIVPSPRSRR